MRGIGAACRISRRSFLHLWWVSDTSRAYCVEAQTGKVLYNEKLSARGGSGPFDASVVLFDGNLYAVGRISGPFVLAAKPRFGQLARNQFDLDNSDFNATPAVKQG